MKLGNLKRLLVVRGATSSGKTAILNKIYADLKIAYPNNVPLIDNAIFNNKTKVDDHQLVMKGVSGRMTAVCTLGDDANWIVKAFELAERFSCEVLVMAVSIPARATTVPIAQIAFDEIVSSNALTSNMSSTKKLKPKPQAGYIDQTIVSKIWKMM